MPHTPRRCACARLRGWTLSELLIVLAILALLLGLWLPSHQQQQRQARRASQELTPTGTHGNASSFRFDGPEFLSESGRKEGRPPWPSAPRYGFPVT